MDLILCVTELMVKVGELCGASVSLRCQLPTEDLDALVSITSDEDLANLIEEYDKAAAVGSSLKIRAFLFPSKSFKKAVSSPPSVSSPLSSTSSPFSSVTHSGCSFSSRSLRCPAPMANRCYKARLPAAAYYPCYEKKSSGKNSPTYGYHQMQGYAAASAVGHAYLVHSGNHWQ